jgi:hypothetical protein
VRHVAEHATVRNALVRSREFRPCCEFELFHGPNVLVRAPSAVATVYDPRLTALTRHQQGAPRRRRGKSRSRAVMYCVPFGEPFQ